MITAKPASILTELDWQIARLGEDFLREALASLAALPDFPPAQNLIDAGLHTTPLEALVNRRNGPLCRLVVKRQRPDRANVLVEWNHEGRVKAMRLTFLRSGLPWKVRMAHEVIPL